MSISMSILAHFSFLARPGACCGTCRWPDCVSWCPSSTLRTEEQWADGNFGVINWASASYLQCISAIKPLQPLQLCGGKCPWQAAPDVFAFRISQFNSGFVFVAGWLCMACLTLHFSTAQPKPQNKPHSGSSRTQSCPGMSMWAFSEASKLASVGCSLSRVKETMLPAKARTQGWFRGLMLM